MACAKGSVSEAERQSIALIACIGDGVMGPVCCLLWMHLSIGWSSDQSLSPLNPVIAERTRKSASASESRWRFPNEGGKEMIVVARMR